MDLTPAQHVVPPPEGGWSAADLSPDEYVDDKFIQTDAARVHAPLMPEDEKLYPTKGAV